MPGWIVVDRIENGVAACELEDGKMRMLPTALLPEGVKEGDCLRERDGRYLPDPVETLRRREENRTLLRSLMGPKRDNLPDDGFSLK